MYESDMIYARTFGNFARHLKECKLVAEYIFKCGERARCNLQWKRAWGTIQGNLKE